MFQSNKIKDVTEHKGVETKSVSFTYEPLSKSQLKITLNFRYDDKTTGTIEFRTTKRKYGKYKKYNLSPTEIFMHKLNLDVYTEVNKSLRKQYE